MNDSLPLIAVGAIGGTISMTRQGGEEGVRPTLKADDLIASVPQIKDIAQLHTETLFSIPSAYIQFEHLGKCLLWARKQVEAGAQGVVLTQGTDTIEETAFYLDLLWDSDVPLVVTGAMRAPQSPGADGPANLFASVITATSERSRGRGVLVVMNDQVFPARWVQKSHSVSVDAFCSKMGAYGEVLESEVDYSKPRIPREVLFTVPVPQSKVLIWQHALSETPDALLALHDQRLFDGLVLSGFGSGHVAPDMANALEKIARTQPVVMCSRATYGSTTWHTYGYEGAEIDLQKRGIMMAGRLKPLKARILLAMCLASENCESNFRALVKRLKSYA